MQNFNILKNLPYYYKSTPVLKSVAGLLEKSSVRFSGIFIKQKDRHFLVLKDGKINVDLDWQAFSIMRASSSLIVTSGAILRSQPGLYMKPESYGNSKVDQLYDNLLNGKSQKLYVISRTCSKQTILKQINQKHYQLHEKIQQNSIYDLFNKLYSDKSNLPISIQIGLNIMNQYFAQIEKGKNNILDTLMISRYSGPLKSQFVGPQLKIDFEKHYDLVWKSQDLECLASGQKGSLAIQFYKIKKQLNNAKFQ